jgi:SAM-dependent methyltransferase/ribosomal protein S18 acetylase RimI-like enzyme
MTGNPPAPRKWTLREIDADDARGLDCIADLHMELLDYGPMAGLGWRFVRDICYATHMGDDLLRVALVTVEGEPAGFVAYTPYSISFHRAGLRRYWLRAGLVLLYSLLIKPTRIVKLVRALKVLVSRRGETVLGSDPLGEVVCVAVRKRFLAPSFMRESGVRLSEALIRYAQEQLGRQGVDKMRMIVDADNKSVLMLYHLMGAHFEPYEQAGEPRKHVWFDIEAPSRAVPACWQDAQEAQGDTWRAYWERIEDNQKCFRVEAGDYVARLRRLVGLEPGLRALDFGCGFGHTATRLAPHVGAVAIWDASSNVRLRAREKTRALANIELADFSTGRIDAGDPGFDLILAHSVLQYMSEDEILAWLAKWREMLRPQGRIVLSDLIPPQAGGVGELLDYLWFALRHGFFWDAFIAGLRESANYSRARRERPLTVVPRARLESWARQSGLVVEWLPENLSHRRARATAVLKKD